MRVLALAAASLFVVSAGMAQTATAAIRHTTNIPAEPISVALRTLAKERGFEVLFRADLVRDVRSSGAVGEFTSEEALQHLLNGTGLTYRYLDQKTVTVIPINAPPSSASNPAPDSEEGKSSASRDFRLAQVDQAGVGDSVSSTAPHPSPVLEEVIVTSRKREERLQDVPVPVSVINTQELVATNQLRLQDYYDRVPGLSVAPSAQSQQLISIRGITTGLTTNPTVGVVVDDVPFGSSTGTGGGFVVPDIDPGDLAGVEVLRGPQGTLYGASSLGGLLKFVTLDPSTTGFSARVQAAVDGSYKGDSPGYGFRGSVNLPLSDSIALRASAFTREDPGYIENIHTGERAVNEARATGGRVAILWAPSDTFKVKLSALVQGIRADGGSYNELPSTDYSQTVGLGDLQQNDLRGAGGYNRKVQAYSATVTARLGAVDLVSVTGYNINSIQDSYDFSFLYGPLHFFGVPGAFITDDNQTRKFNQELRLSGHLGPRIEWLVGGFFTHEDSAFRQANLAVDETTSAVAGTILGTTFPTTLQDWAGFADLTYHFTDRFDVQIGGRESEIDQSYTSITGGPLLGLFGLADPSVIPKTHASETAFTYLVTPRFRISPELMVYFRAASGYRAGGPNVSVGLQAQYRQFKPDKTNDFEVGAKADVLEHRLLLDVSLYYIDWKNIQLQATPVDGFAFITNAGGAKSQGAELSLQAKPTDRLTVSAWTSWSDAHLTHPFPEGSGTYGAVGDRLPYAGRFSGSVSIQQNFPILGRVSGFTGATASYVGSRQGEFTQTPERQVYGGYAKTDLRAGATFETWTLTAYVTNLFDRRGVLSGGLGTTIPPAFYDIEPRSIGMTIAKTF